MQELLFLTVFLSANISGTKRTFSLRSGCVEEGTLRKQSKRDGNNN